MGAAILYIVSPIDFFPDFYPFIGWIEDILIGILAMRFVRRRVGTDADDEACRKEGAITVDAKVIEEDQQGKETEG